MQNSRIGVRCREPSLAAEVASPYQDGGDSGQRCALVLIPAQYAPFRTDPPRTATGAHQDWQSEEESGERNQPSQYAVFERNALPGANLVVERFG